MNISLAVARAREEARLTALVAEIALEQGRDVNDRPHRTRVADPQALRGLPAVGAALRRQRDRRHTTRHRRTSGQAGVSSRLAVDASGRTVATVTTPLPDLEPGYHFLVVDPHLVGLMPILGRLPSPRERTSVRAPYDSSSEKRRRAQLVEVPDDELDEAAALAAAYAEQRRQPADLIGRAA